MYRTMYNVLVILLHRPFVSGGHLYTTSSAIARDAFSICSTAAFETDRIIQIYEKQFCLKATPYVISYGIYVSATIHVRLAAQREYESDAHKALRRCLDVLDIQQAVCWSSRRAKRVIKALVARMGVVLDNGEPSVEESHDQNQSNIDIDATMRTFVRDHPHMASPAQLALSHLVDGSGSFRTSNSTLHASNGGPSSINPHGLLSDYRIPFAFDDTEFLSDVIFGFNGTEFDNLDLSLGVVSCDLVDG
jgi:hypothetical protein